MEKVFNNPEIAEFIGHYPINHWVPILEAFSIYSIRSLVSHYPRNTYPTIAELFTFFRERTDKTTLSEEVADLYAHLHKIDKKMRKIVKRTAPDKIHSKKSHHSNAKATTRSREGKVVPTNTLPSISTNVLMDRAKERIERNFFTPANHPRGKETFASPKPGAPIFHKRGHNQVADPYRAAYAPRCQTELGNYNDPRLTNSRKSAFASTREGPCEETVSTRGKENRTHATHSTNSPGSAAPSIASSNKILHRKLGGLNEIDLCIETNGAIGKNRRSVIEKATKGLLEKVPRRESIRSSNEKYETWLSETGDIKNEIPTSHFEPLEIDLDMDRNPASFSRSSGEDEAPAKVFNKFTTLIANHKLKHEREEAEDFPTDHVVNFLLKPAYTNH